MATQSRGHGTVRTRTVKVYGFDPAARRQTAYTIATDTRDSHSGGTHMKMMRVTAAALALAVVGGVAYLAKDREPTGGRMADAAQKFVDGLTAEQKAKAVFGFDDKE